MRPGGPTNRPAYGGRATRPKGAAVGRTAAARLAPLPGWPAAMPGGECCGGERVKFPLVAPRPTLPQCRLPISFATPKGKREIWIFATLGAYRLSLRSMDLKPWTAAWVAGERLNNAP